MDNNTQNEKSNWYDKKALVFVLLLIFCPVGLYALWKNNLFAKKTKIILTSVLSGLMLLGILSENSSENPPPAESLAYTITSDKTDTWGKGKISVQLPGKTTSDVLRKIALRLKEDRPQKDILYIYYSLPNQTKDCWAISHFTPELEVEILGSTEKEDKQTSQTSDIDGEVIGKWRCEISLSGASLVLFLDPNKKLMMKMTFKDGSSSTREITKSEDSGKTRYDDGSPHGEYYILESNGHLGLYGASGKFDEAVIIN